MKIKGSIKDPLDSIRKRAKVNIPFPMEMCIKEILRTTIFLDLGWSTTAIRICITEISKMVNGKVKAFWKNRMEINMKENLKQMSCTGKENIF
jgi:hypothetical protein